MVAVVADAVVIITQNWLHGPQAVHALRAGKHVYSAAPTGITVEEIATESFEDAIRQGIARATKTLRQVKSAWIKEQRVEVTDGRITTYQVNLLVTFILEE